MKRFYSKAETAPQPGGVAIRLDGRPVKTPARAALLLPTEELAEAIAAFARPVRGIDRGSIFSLCPFHSAAIDRVAPDPEAFARGLAAYGESDLLCYRADTPQPLIDRQAASWDPILDWARGRFEVDFNTTSGVMHRAQPVDTVERLGGAIRARDPFRLAAMSPLVTISGSLVIALALAEGEIGLDTAWAAATLDEAWQAEQWGEDPLAVAAYEERRRDFEAAYRFLTLL